jgi:hypothetical protein
VERGLPRDAVELRIMDGLPGLETIFRATLFLPSETACEAPHGVPDFSRLEHLPDEKGEQRPGTGKERGLHAGRC